MSAINLVDLTVLTMSIRSEPAACQMLRLLKSLFYSKDNQNCVFCYCTNNDSRECYSAVLSWHIEHGCHLLHNNRPLGIMNLTLYYLIVEKLLVSTWFIGQICRGSPWVIFKEGWLLNEPTSFSYEIPTMHEAHFSGRFRNFLASAKGRCFKPTYT